MLCRPSVGGCWRPETWASTTDFGHRGGDHHTVRVEFGSRARPYRWGHASADPDSHRMAANAHPTSRSSTAPAKSSCSTDEHDGPPAPGQRLVLSALERGCTNRAPLHPTAARSTTPNGTGSTAATPTSTNSRWRADATIAWSTTPQPAGIPENAKSDNRTGVDSPPHLDRGQCRVISTTTRRGPAGGRRPGSLSP